MSARKPASKPDNPEQHKRFVDMAREVGVDETPGAFDRAFDKVITSESVQRQSPQIRKREKKVVR
jgi:hypothetical protein